LSDAWDTTVASRIYPGNAYEQELVRRALTGHPVALTAPGVMEIAHGLGKAARSSERGHGALTWFTRLVTSGLVAVLALDVAAAVVAGRLRAVYPVPPSGERRSGTKPEQRAGWLLDLQIAAAAWVAGHSIVTHNRRDFETIAHLIADLYSTVPPLDVLDPPPLG
jgi:predicted nucleic acid-binding protein